MRLLFVVAAVACVQAPNETEPPAPPPATTVDPDRGSIHIDLGDGTGAPRILAAFVEPGAPLYNLAECAAEADVPCLPIPTSPDQQVGVSSNDRLDRAGTESRSVGTLQVGGFDVPMREDAKTGFGFYAATLAADEALPDPIGIEWTEGDAFSDPGVLPLGDTVALTSPLPGAEVEIRSDTELLIEWTPSDADITLQVSTGAGDWVYFLDNDGSFSFPVDDVDYLGPTDDVTFALRAWSRVSLSGIESVVDAMLTSHQTFTAAYTNVGNRDELRAADTCDGVAELPALETGIYWGRLDWYDASLDAECVAPGCANGFDGVYPLVLPPRTLFQAEYLVYDDSASMYLLADCADAASCLDGTDADPNVGTPEYLQRLNLTEQTEQLYLVVDSSGSQECLPDSEPVASYYTLDVVLDRVAEPPMVDTCLEAAAAPVSFLGVYYAELTEFTGDLDPGIGGCTQTEVPGPEAMTPVEVAPGATLTVTIDMPGGDPALYVLYQCDNAFSCPVGVDRETGAREVLTYTNQSAVAERVFVVVDTAEEALLPYVLTLEN